MARIWSGCSWRRPDWHITNVGLITYAANPSNLANLASGGRYDFGRGDIADRVLVGALFAQRKFDAGIHGAAESHVDRSIRDSGIFLRTNVAGTLVLLEAARDNRVSRFVQMSTDEVHGSLLPGDPPFTEKAPLSPRSPYSASKAAADHLVLAFHHTHNLASLVTRCSNNYGSYQHPEKLVPLMITAALRGREMPVYGDGRQRRAWIYVEDHCRGVLAALEQGRAGEVYNFGGDAECENLDVIERVLELVGRDYNLLRHVTDRPGHDRRYAMAFEKARRELSWQPLRSFEEGLRKTIGWCIANQDWWTEAADSAYEESRRMIAAWGGASADGASSSPARDPCNHA